MSAPGGFLNGELDEQPMRRFAAVNERHLRGVMASYGRDAVEVELVFEDGERLLFLTVPLAAVRDEEGDR